jgi:hypothetical protein
MSQTAQERNWGLLAQFDSPGALLRAARGLRNAGYCQFDAHSPFPVHGMDSAMGLGRSHLGWIVSGGAVAGAMTALVLQYYTNWEYPLIHQGKPYYSWQAFLVVTFELTVLFAAISAVVGMFVLNGLPCWYHPTLKSGRFAVATDNGFFISLELKETEFDEARKVLNELGATSVEELED